MLAQDVILEGAVARTPDEVRMRIQTYAIAAAEGIGLFTDSLSSLQQIESFWSWRSNTPKAIVQCGPSSIHFDISLEMPLLYDLVTATREWATKEGLIGTDIYAVYGYGHVGDGNMHLTVRCNMATSRMIKLINQDALLLDPCIER